MWLAPDASALRLPVTLTFAPLAPLVEMVPFSAVRFCASTLLAPLASTLSCEVSPSTFYWETPETSAEKDGPFTPATETLATPEASTLSISGAVM